MDSKQHRNLRAMCGSAAGPASPSPGAQAWNNDPNESRASALPEARGASSATALPPWQRLGRTHSDQEQWVGDRINRIEAAVRALTENMEAMKEIDHQRQAAIFRQHAGTGPDAVAALASSPSLPGAHREHELESIVDQYLTLQDIDLSWCQPDLDIPMEADFAYGTPAHHQARDNDAVELMRSPQVGKFHGGQDIDVLHSMVQGTVDGYAATTMSWADSELTCAAVPSSIVPGCGGGGGWYNSGLGIDPVNPLTPHTNPPPDLDADAKVNYLQPDINTLPASNGIATSVQRSAAPTYVVAVSDGIKHYRCECGHETTRKGDMNRHHECLGHSLREYGCPCGRKFTRKDSCKRHMRRCRQERV